MKRRSILFTISAHIIRGDGTAVLTSKCFNLRTLPGLLHIKNRRVLMCKGATLFVRSLTCVIINSN